MTWDLGGAWLMWAGLAALLLAVITIMWDHARPWACAWAWYLLLRFTLWRLARGER